MCDNIKNVHGYSRDLRTHQTFDIERNFLLFFYISFNVQREYFFILYYVYTTSLLFPSYTPSSEPVFGSRGWGTKKQNNKVYVSSWIKLKTNVLLHTFYSFNIPIGINTIPYCSRRNDIKQLLMNGFKLA